MLKVSSGKYTYLDNFYYKNKEELINDLMVYGDCSFNYNSEEDTIARQEGYTDIKEKLLTFTGKELINLFEQVRGVLL